MLGESDSIDVFQLIAERKILEAMERGEFDQLPGQGKPLLLDYDPLESPEQRLVNQVLKNAGMVPVEISLRRELAELKREYACAKSPAARQTLLREIRLMVLRLNILHKTAVQSDALDD